MVLLDRGPAMIKFTNGDILKYDVDAIVNTVNCVGIMGRGIALQFKNAFPDNFKAYKIACQKNEVTPGKMFIYDRKQLTQPRFIINFPTKRHWRGKSRIEDIKAGLVSLEKAIIENKITSIAIPPLGSGLGGLNWNEVKSLITNQLKKLSNVDIIVFEPGHSPETSKYNSSSAIPKMTAGRAALVGLIKRYLGGLLDPTISLLEVHKLMYLLQEAGEPLRLHYVKANYGPYAENLRHVLREIEGHLISGYADGGDSPTKQLALVPGATSDAENFLDQHPETLDRFNRVVKLVEGFETPFGLELLSTVHWVCTKEHACTIEHISNATHSWSERKLQFSSMQIKLAYERIKSEGFDSCNCDQH